MWGAHLLENLSLLRQLAPRFLVRKSLRLGQEKSIPLEEVMTLWIQVRRHNPVELTIRRPVKIQVRRHNPVELTFRRSVRESEH